MSKPSLTVFVGETAIRRNRPEAIGMVADTVSPWYKVPSRDVATSKIVKEYRQVIDIYILYTTNILNLTKNCRKSAMGACTATRRGKG
mgnify:CR=1 FL=1